MVNIRIYGYSDTLLVIFSMRVCSQNSGTYCMVPSDWDLALTCICGPNFRSNSSENSPDFLFVCLFVWLNKPRTVKPLRRFHSWSLSFTQDGLAFSTKTARRVLQVQLVGIAIVTNDVIFLSNCFGWNPRNYTTIHPGLWSTESGNLSVRLQVGWAQVSTRICWWLVNSVTQT